MVGCLGGHVLYRPRINALTCARGVDPRVLGISWAFPVFSDHTGRAASRNALLESNAKLNINGGTRYEDRVALAIRVFTIYQILFGWETCKYYYETVELPNPRPIQPKKS